MSIKKDLMRAYHHYKQVKGVKTADIGSHGRFSGRKGALSGREYRANDGGLLSLEQGARLQGLRKMTNRGYYSLIQFVPNPGREEGANVGVVVICPKFGSVAVQMAEHNESAKRMFTAAAFDNARLNVAKDAIAGRIRGDLGPDPTLEKLKWFRSIESNWLQLTEPKAIAIGEALDRVANALFDDIVHMEERHRSRAAAPSTNWLVTFLEDANVPITKPGSVEIPVVNESLPVAFSYVNGARHFVHPQGFSATREAAMDKAKGVGAQGRLLHNHSVTKSHPDKLVVFGKFMDPSHSQTVKTVLEEMDVRLVSEDEQESFAAEVKASAH